MPHRVWKHRCSSNQNEVLIAKPVCPACHEHGEYDGWSYSRIEAMSAYRRRTGLKPIGPHRNYADALFNLYLLRCEGCGGRGVVDVAGGSGCSKCLVCEGECYIFIGDRWTKQLIQHLVLKVFPKATSTAR